MWEGGGVMDHPHRLDFGRVRRRIVLRIPIDDDMTFSHSSLLSFPFFLWW